MRVGGEHFPGSAALDNTKALEQKAYAEAVAGSTGVPAHRYATDRHYIPIDFTASEGVFTIPHIAASVGTQTSGRNIMLQLQLDEEYSADTALDAYIFNYT